MTTPDRPPLWKEVDRAWWSLVDTTNPHASPPESDQAACVIRAVRDWLVPEEPLYDGDQRWELERDQRQRLRALLTTEADRAERGDG